MGKKGNNIAGKSGELLPLAPPKSEPHHSNFEILLGKPIPAIDQLKIISDNDFENFTREWLIGARKKDYCQIFRSSGSGDLGRDVVAYVEDSNSNPTAIWDNYQCKHYDHPLAPSDIHSEIGKHIYFAFKKDFLPPRKYYFVAPQGCGPKLASLFLKPAELKKEVQNAWDQNCAKKIIKGETITKVNIPESFNVLVRELKGLSLDVELLKNSKKIEFGDDKNRRG